MTVADMLNMLALKFTSATGKFLQLVTVELPPRAG
jgi:hypothetical protein